MSLISLQKLLKFKRLQKLLTEQLTFSYYEKLNKLPKVKLLFFFSAFVWLLAFKSDFILVLNYVKSNFEIFEIFKQFFLQANSTKMFSLKSFMQNHINKICSYVWSLTRSNTLNRKFISILDFRGLSLAHKQINVNLPWRALQRRRRERSKLRKTSLSMKEQKTKTELQPTIPQLKHLDTL